MKVFNATEEDFQGICEVQFGCYPVMYSEQPERKKTYKIMLKKRMQIGKDWMFVLKQNSKILGICALQPVIKTNIEEFDSWENQTDNGTLQKTFNQKGDKVFVVNLDILPEATARNCQHILVRAIYKKLVETGKDCLYWESRLPLFREYVKKTIGLQQWLAKSDVDKKKVIKQYISLKVMKNGKEVYYDKLIRFFQIGGFKPQGVILLNAFNDPQSLNCGLLYYDKKASTFFSDAIRKYSKNTGEIKEETLMLRSIINFKNQICNDQNYIKASLTSPIKQQEFFPIDKVLYRFQEAILAPPHPYLNQILEQEVYIRFLHTLQLVIDPLKIDHHLRQISYDNYEMLKSEGSLKYIDLWIQKGSHTLTQPAKWNPHNFDLKFNEPHYGFENWHDFFTRKINLKLHPVDSDDDIIVMPCQSYPLLIPLQPVQNIQGKDKFWLKNTHYSLYDMLDVYEMKNEEIMLKFVGGTIFQAFMDYWCYHGWHAPVSGVIQSIYTVPGFFFLLKPGTEKPNLTEFELQQPFLSCVATRQIIIIKSDNPNIGRVIFIAISMAEVSSCVATVKIGERIEKGQEIGHFQMGSSFCLIFEKNCKLQFFTKDYYDLKDGKLQPKLMKLNSALCKVNRKQLNSST